jgi:hypothetical protein
MTQGREYLNDSKWKKMKTSTFGGEYLDKISKRMSAEGVFSEDNIRVMWLSITLFFTVGGYWLLRSLKDPIISIIDGVSFMKYS